MTTIGDTASASAVVHVESGDLVGTVSADGEVRAFKGVPYARPPIGPLRWRAPVPAEPWSGRRPAEKFGPRSIQFDRATTSISYFGSEPEDEDCLYLNIWTAARSPEENLPVMVWFHGGTYLVGSGSLPIFNGEALARRGVVLVTVNYRLGVLGFLAHPELTSESPHQASGNWGLLDQVSALRWIRDNVAAFGGDPGRVTIFGQSAGSTSVNSLMASPLARGLFHRAIGQSGGLMGPLGRSGGGSMIRLDEAERLGLSYVETCGASSIDDMRTRPARDIQLSWPAGFGRPPRPILDGWVLPDGVHEVFTAGRQNDVPLLAGSNADEGSTRPAPANWADFRASLEKDYGGDAKTLLESYGTSADVGETSRLLGGHITFNWQNWTWAREHARSGRSKVFFYHFDRAPPVPADMPCFENAADKLGAFHTAEIHYIFGTLPARAWPWRNIDRRLSEMMSSYWVNFAATGDPNGEDLPHWPVFDTATDSTLLLGERIVAGAMPIVDKLDLWDSCVAHMRGA